MERKEGSFIGRVAAVVKESANRIWGVEPEHRVKILLLGLVFGLLTAAQAVWRPLKSAVFFSLVGVSSIPHAKILTVIPIAFAVMLFSWMSERVAREKLFVSVTAAHAIGGLVAAFFLSRDGFSPVILTERTTGSVVLGWSFYALMESFGAFMSMSFWSMTASIVTTREAEAYYPLLVVSSKTGGILSAFTLYAATKFVPIGAHATLVPSAVAFGSVALILASIIVIMMKRWIPKEQLRGQAEKVERAAGIEGEKEKAKKKAVGVRGVLDGIKILFKVPYVGGIFASIFMYETIIVILDYVTNIVVSAHYNSVVGVAGYYARYMGTMHSIGLLIALFGTSPLQRLLGVRASMLATPLVASAAGIVVLLSGNKDVLWATLAVLRASNYAIHHPARETLFVPTTFEVRYKAKAWIDSLGSRIAKAFGSMLNKDILHGMRESSATTVVGISIGWLMLAKVVADRYREVIASGKIVGMESEKRLAVETEIGKVIPAATAVFGAGAGDGRRSGTEKKVPEEDLGGAVVGGSANNVRNSLKEESNE